jgi:hypothetical protein
LTFQTVPTLPSKFTAAGLLMPQAARSEPGG